MYNGVNAPNSIAQRKRGERMKAYEVIEQNDWCQLAFAKNSDGHDTHSLDPNAVSFCVSGAIRKAYYACSGETIYDVQLSLKRYENVMDCLADEVNVPVLNITAWNDEPGRTKDEVVDALKRAEARYESLLRQCE